MMDIVYFIMDILEYGFRGLLLVYLLWGLLEKRYPFQVKYATEFLVWLQFLSVQLFYSNSPVLKKLFYGDSMIPTSMKPSLIGIGVSMLLTMTVCFVLYKGSRLVITYLVVIYYSLMELVRFSLYTFMVWALECLMNFNMWLTENGNIVDMDFFYQLVSISQFIWNIVLLLSTCLSLFLIVKKYKGYLNFQDYLLRKTDIFFMGLPGVIGLSLSFLLRCILFSYRDNQVHLLVTDNPEMNYIIPMISVLCIASVLLSARILERLVEETQEKVKIQIYQDRIHGMEEHMKDVERLYDGIRGMRHDMKNYISDINGLLKQENAKKGESTELKGYVDSLDASLKQLDMEYQTGNPVTDVVVNRYLRRAREKGVAVECEFYSPSNLSISAFDLSVLLNNSLENALEACETHPGEEQFLRIYTKRRGNMFFLEIQNSFDGVISFSPDDKTLKTTKEEKQLHGFGIKNIRNIVQKYRGGLNYEVRDGCFYLRIMLQGERLEENS